MNRREFVRNSSMGIVGGMAAGSLSGKLYAKASALAGQASSTRKTPIQYIRENIPPVEIPPYRGRRYEAVIPETLDLADRARIAVEGVLTTSTDPDYDHEVYIQADMNWQPPIMYHSFHDFNGCQPKYLESLALLRSACGSDVNLEVDRRLYGVALHMVGEDGLSYVPVKGRPWALFDDWKSVLRSPNLPPSDVQHVFSLYPDGRNLLALCAWHMRNPDDSFTKELIQKKVKGLAAIGVEKDGFLYFPFELIYRTPHGTLSAGGTYGGEARPPVPIEQALASARVEKLTVSPPACTDASASLQGLARYYRMTGDERTGQLAGKLAHYVCQTFDEDGTFRWGHVHLNLFAAIGLVDYADAVGDKNLAGLAERAYLYGRSLAVPTVGFFPEFRKPGLNLRTSESCADADAVVLAIKLSEYGIGDYWEDVDRYVRNHLAEAQLIDTDWAYRAHNLPTAEGKERCLGFTPPKEVGDLIRVPGFLIQEKVPERLRGAFATHASINDWYPGWAGELGQREGHSGCCTGNGSRSLYFAWRAILKQQNGTLKVNLLLNRASPWADVDSHLPYAGRVDIHVKTPNQLLVRIPEWVPTHTVKLQVNGVARTYGWQGRYLDAGHVDQGQEVTIEFPIEERTVTVDVPFGENPKVTLVLRGNDVVEIDPRGPNNPFYQREHYRQGKTLWKKVTRFEPAELYAV